MAQTDPILSNSRFEVQTGSFPAFIYEDEGARQPKRYYLLPVPQPEQADNGGAWSWKSYKNPVTNETEISLRLRIQPSEAARDHAYRELASRLQGTGVQLTPWQLEYLSPQEIQVAIKDGIELPDGLGLAPEVAMQSGSTNTVRLKYIIAPDLYKTLEGTEPHSQQNVVFTYLERIPVSISFSFPAEQRTTSTVSVTYQRIGEGELKNYVDGLVEHKEGGWILGPSNQDINRDATNAWIERIKSRVTISQWKRNEAPLDDIWTPELGAEFLGRLTKQAEVDWEFARDHADRLGFTREDLDPSLIKDAMKQTLDVDSGKVSSTSQAAAGGGFSAVIYGVPVSANLFGSKNKQQIKNWFKQHGVLLDYSGEVFVPKSLLVDVVSRTDLETDQVMTWETRAIGDPIKLKTIYDVSLANLSMDAADYESLEARVQRLERGGKDRLQAINDAAVASLGRQVPLGSVISSMVSWEQWDAIPPATRSQWLPADGRDIPLGSALGQILAKGARGQRLRTPDTRGKFVRGLNMIDPANPMDLATAINEGDPDFERQPGDFQRDSVLEHTHPLFSNVSADNHKKDKNSSYHERVVSLGERKNSDWVLHSPSGHYESTWNTYKIKGVRPFVAEGVTVEDREGKVMLVNRYETRVRNVALYHYIKIN
ncbi:MAG: hypothetical protein KDN19_16240 [Verrucomicrobiae bacterium]|nr:hypothetical protein [Verrucomicrobiae bacterium]